MNVFEKLNEDGGVVFAESFLLFLQKTSFVPKELILFIISRSHLNRGVFVESLEMLNYGTEGRGFESVLGQLAKGRLSLSTQQQTGAVLNLGRQLKEWDGLILSYDMPLISTAPTAAWLLGSK